MNEDYFRHLQEEYFVTFFTEEVGSEDYTQAQGQLYQEIVGDVDVPRNEAMKVSAYLNNGEVDEAEEHLASLLEEDR